MKYLIAACFAFLFVNTAQAKCVTHWYEFAGKVGAPGGKPIPNAVIEIYWSELGEYFNRRETSISNASGLFSLSVPFYTFIRMEGAADICGAVLSGVKLRISAQGFETSDAMLSVSGDHTMANKTMEPTR